MDYPILEFDTERVAIIEPGRIIPRIDLPECCVLCFFNDVIRMVDATETIKTQIVHHIGSEIGRVPVYVVEHNGQWCTVVHPGVGAPLAAAFLEEIIDRKSVV